jgi:hypothetical protein
MREMFEYRAGAVPQAKANTDSGRCVLRLTRNYGNSARPQNQAFARGGAQLSESGRCDRNVICRCAWGKPDLDVRPSHFDRSTCRMASPRRAVL